MSEKAILLQTDIVDSTLLNERLGDSANAVLRARHDAVARDLLTRWDGQELERSDGFLLRFGAVDAAIGYAIDYHRATRRLDPPLPARAGIHVGTIELRQNIDSHIQLGAKEYDARGVAIAVTVRIMALAGGGQTLMSQAARAAAGESGRRIVSHGHWRLKGLDEPLELFEVGDTDAPFATPADAPKAFRVVWKNDHWLPRREVAHSLPAERNSFVGRKTGLRDLEARIGGNARLLTILGTGGTGKTRLSQHYGWSHLGDFAGGVWFCDLSNARTLDGLCSAVAQGLGFSLGQTDPVEQVGAAIAGRGDCLIILDNFEQIVGYALQSVGRWLDRAIDASFVVTSRSTLGLDGEQVLALAPLDIAEGSELFEHRAAAGGWELDHDKGDAAQVRTLISLLDGLPLAIELAAARARVLDVPTLVARMRDRFKLLTSGDGRPSRQATLRTTFDWSWELLNVIERTTLAQLSVFEGGFDLAATEAVCRLSGDASPIEAIDALQSLLDKSWIRRTSSSRFALLNSIQEYAAERLRADASECRAAEARHGDYYASLDERNATIERGVELDNLVAATRRAIAAGEAARASAALERSWFVLKLRGPYRTASTLAEDVLSLEGLATIDRVLTEFVAGDAAQSTGAIGTAIAHFEAGLALARVDDFAAHEARLLCALGECFTDAARPDDARSTLEAALSRADAMRDEQLQCKIFKALGNLRQSLGDASDAQRWYERALAIAQRLEDHRWEGGLYGNVGAMHHLQGHMDLAQRFYDLAIARAEQLGDMRWENNARCNLGLLLGEKGDLVNARLELERASTNARTMGHARLECIATCNLGVICADADDVVASRRYYERALELACQLNDLRAEAQTRGHFGLLLARTGEHREAHEHLERGVAILEQVTDDLSLGALLCQRAEANLLNGEVDACTTDWERARTIAIRIGVEKDSPLQLAIDRLAARVAEHAISTRA
jgi:predicted ATPase/class 3 adenylate cyclase/Tfp pilus assembly protein PilF